jgi:hypothetical protein
MVCTGLKRPGWNAVYNTPYALRPTPYSDMFAGKIVNQDKVVDSAAAAPK